MSHADQNTSSNWTPPTVVELQAMLPRYEVKALWGRGGMGAVYKGRQKSLHRDVAIKVLPENFATGKSGSDPHQFVERFKLEARAMANLDHPAILSVYDFGQTEKGHLYLVMEFIEGMDIHAYLQHNGGSLPEKHAIAICAHVLDALQYAHDHGVIHRDIKPANVLINSEGRVKLADFGLAKRIAAAEGEDSGAPLTLPDMAMGTPDFAAPEIFENKRPSDGRVDLYAVGVMLYQLLTGKLPRGQFEPPSKLLPDLDPRFDEIVSKALQANPDDRYPSATAFRSDLDRILSQPIPKAADPQSSAVPVAKLAEQAAPASNAKGKPIEPKKSKAPLFTGIGLAAVLLIGIGVYVMTRPGRDAGVGTDVPAVRGESAESKPESPPKENLIASTETADGQGRSSLPADPVDPPKAPEPATPVIVGIDNKPAPPKTGEAGAGTDVPAVREKGKTPEPAAPDPPPPPSTLPKPEPEPAVATAQLASIPGLKKRLDAYLIARRSAVEELATSYLKGLDGRMNQAADAGNLKLTKAYRGEKAQVEALQKALAEPVTDPVEAVGQAATLPPLTADAPDGLVGLRKIWQTERQKILSDLDGKLQRSLETLESELTKARKLEQAEMILAYREGLDGIPPAMVAGIPESANPGPPLSKSVISQTVQSGNLRAFGRIMGEEVHVESAERWSDFTEVVATNLGWTALRENGRVVNSEGEIDSINGRGTALADDPGGSRRIPPVITRTGEVEGGMPSSEGLRNVIGYCGGTGLELALQTDGKVVFIGPENTRTPPPADALIDAKQVACTFTWAFVLKKDGRVFGWPRDNEVNSIEKLIESKGSVEIAANAAGCIGLNHEGKVALLWANSRLLAPPDDLADVVAIRGGGYVFAAKLRDGSWRAWGLPASQAVIDTINSLTNGVELDLCCMAYGGVDTEYVVWIEGKDARSANQKPAPLSVTQTPPPATTPQIDRNALKLASKEQPFVNSLGMKFVPVPGTDILMCIHETRRKDYAGFADNNPDVPSSWNGTNFGQFVITDRVEDHPVIAVSWDDAKSFCQWLGGNEGYKYRLPTDREWSAAVGLGRKERWSRNDTPESVLKDQTEFPWGTNWPPPTGAGNYSDESRREKAPRAGAAYLDGYRDGFPTTAPVMSFSPNDFGLYDLGGNVREWCEDWWNSEKKERVMRGSYSEVGGGANGFLSSIRWHYEPSHRNGSFGFRVVIDPKAEVSADPQTAAKPAWSPAVIKAALDRKPGRLYAFGIGATGGEIGFSTAHGLDDLTAVQERSGGNWVALRTNGKLISNYQEGTVSVNRRIKKLSTGHYHTAVFAIDSTDSVRLAHVYSQYNEDDLKPKPALEKMLRDVVELSTGDLQFMALTKDGKVVVWGPKYDLPGAKPPPESGLIDIRAIATQNSACFVAKNDGSVVAWEAGSGPVEVPDHIRDVVQLSTASAHSLALTFDGRVLAWGSDSYDQCKVPEGLGKCIAIEASGYLSAARLENGSWVAWGDNTKGIVDKINSLGPITDLSFSSAPPDFGYVLWIKADVE